MFGQLSRTAITTLSGLFPQVNKVVVGLRQRRMSKITVTSSKNWVDREELGRFSVIQGHFTNEMIEYYKERFPNAPWVTVVRDPFHRALSHYRYIVERGAKTGITPDWFTMPDNPRDT